MTIEHQSPSGQELIAAATDEVFIRQVEELLRAYPRAVIEAAAAVTGRLPHLGVENGMLVERETHREQIRRQMGRISSRELED